MANDAFISTGMSFLQTKKENSLLEWCKTGMSRLGFSLTEGQRREHGLPLSPGDVVLVTGLPHAGGGHVM